MLVLVSFVLVLAAMATLIAGLLGEGLTLIYVSIGCSLAAGLILVLAVLKGRPDSSGGRASAPARPVGAGASTAGATAAATQSFTPTTEPAAPARTWDEPATVATPTPSARPTTPPSAPSAPSAPVAARAGAETAGANLLQRLRSRGSQAPVEASSEAVEAAAIETDAMGGDEMHGDGSTDSTETREFAVGMGSGTDSSKEHLGEDGFPIPGYDDLRAVDVIAAVNSLQVGELELVRDRESAGKNRFTIMNRIDDRMDAMAAPLSAWGPDDEVPGDDPVRAPIPAPPAGRTATKRATTARKAAATGAAPAKKTATTSRTAKAPAKKLVAPKKAAAQAPPAKKAVPAKRAAPARQAAPAKKVSARQAAPAKKVPVKKAPARRTTKS